MKTSRARPAAKPSRHDHADITALDQAQDSCQSVVAIGEMLAICEVSHLSPGTIPAIGHLLCAETVKLTAALKTLTASLAKHGTKVEPHRGKS
jgi:hypothetical protein